MAQHPPHGYWLVGRNRVVILLGTPTPDERGTVLIQSWGNAGDGAPLHRHRDVETFVVTKGRLRFWVAGTMTECGPQESATVPSGADHTYVVLEPDSEWLMLLTDSAFDHFIAEGATPVIDPSDPSESAEPPDPAIAAKYGQEILGPPPAELRG
ncbi:MAG TPA: cupin domain-containing protein [Baekduia sp.]